MHKYLLPGCDDITECIKNMDVMGLNGKSCHGKTTNYLSLNKKIQSRSMMLLIFDISTTVMKKKKISAQT